MFNVGEHLAIRCLGPSGDLSSSRRTSSIRRSVDLYKADDLPVRRVIQSRLRSRSPNPRELHDGSLVLRHALRMSSIWVTFQCTGRQAVTLLDGGLGQEHAFWSYSLGHPCSSEGTWRCRLVSDPLATSLHPFATGSFTQLRFLRSSWPVGYS